MLINFTKKNAGVLNIPIPRTEDKILEKDRKVSAERRAHYSPKFVSLIPGMQEIPDKVWNNIKNTERVQTYLKRGDIVLVHAEKVPSKKEGVPYKDLSIKDFKDLSSDEQKEVISECELVKQLKKWSKNTKEATKPFLNDKIDRLENPEKYQDDED